MTYHINQESEVVETDGEYDVKVSDGRFSVCINVNVEREEDAAFMKELRVLLEKYSK